MKLAVLALATTLGLGSLQVADAQPAPLPAPGPLAQPGPAPLAPPAPRAGRPASPLRQFLIERFDRDHDRRLDGRERRRAARALRKLADRMERDGGPHRAARMRHLVRRFDQNGDGVVGPGELPPDTAHRLRPLDRNRDGWLDDRDQR